MIPNNLSPCDSCWSSDMISPVQSLKMEEKASGAFLETTARKCLPVAAHDHWANICWEASGKCLSLITGWNRSPCPSPLLLHVLHLGDTQDCGSPMSLEPRCPSAMRAWVLTFSEWQIRHTEAFQLQLSPTSHGTNHRVTVSQPFIMWNDRSPFGYSTSIRIFLYMWSDGRRVYFLWSGVWQSNNQDDEICTNKGSSRNASLTPPYPAAVSF